jgi:hypothetical protein
MALFGSSNIQVHRRWTQLHELVHSRNLSLQYDETPEKYEIFAIDDKIVFVTEIWKGPVPPAIEATYSQSQNDADKTDFETNHKQWVFAALPKTPDSRQVVVISPATEGWQTWLTGAGDTLSPPAVGTGTKIRLSWTAEESRGLKTVDIQFIEPIEVHDGQAVFYPVGNWTPDDCMSMKVIIPANSTTTNGGGTGNCNRVPSGLGYDVIVPAAGNGAYDIDLSTAVPLPAPSKDGYWDVDYDDGTVTASEHPGNAAFHLIAAEVKVGFLNRMPAGQAHGVIDVDVYKTEWIHNGWKIRVECDKQSAGAGEFGGWLLTFRHTVNV